MSWPWRTETFRSSLAYFFCLIPGPSVSGHLPNYWVPHCCPPLAISLLQALSLLESLASTFFYGDSSKSKSPTFIIQIWVLTLLITGTLAIEFISSKSNSSIFPPINQLPISSLKHPNLGVLFGYIYLHKWWQHKNADKAQRKGRSSTLKLSSGFITKQPWSHETESILFQIQNVT